MNQKTISSSFVFVLALLLAACDTSPVKPVAQDEPVVAEAPAPGSQDEADAVAEGTAAEEAQDTAAQPEDVPADAGATSTAPAKPAAKADAGPAQSHAVAAAVLPPVWIYRGALSTALLPGTAIYEDDRIETGADGRVQLSLDDNGALQLGGNTHLTVGRMRANETASLNGTLDLSQGTFAYESGRNGTLLPGDLDFKLGKLTASISQAALMGRNGGKESLVCLLGGSVEIAMPEQAPVKLDTAKACITTSKTAVTGAGTAQQLNSLQQDTRPPAGIKAMKTQGVWSLIFTSEASEATAKQQALKLWKSGYPAEVIEAKVKGKTYYRVALRGLESRDAANAFKKRAVALGYKKAWASGK